jgi:hypothetical protein
LWFGSKITFAESNFPMRRARLHAHVVVTFNLIGAVGSKAAGQTIWASARSNINKPYRSALGKASWSSCVTAGTDVTPLCETSADNQFSGFGPEFHFDTGNQTLSFSADGSTASAITVATVQPGVTLNPHDLLIV